MARFSLSFTVLFTLFISVLSAPVPYPQAIATGPVTSGELTVPTRGGTFHDFKIGARNLHDDTDQLLAPRVSESDGVDQESTFWSRGFEVKHNDEEEHGDQFNIVPGLLGIAGLGKGQSKGQNAPSGSNGPNVVNPQSGKLEGTAQAGSGENGKASSNH